MQADVIQRLNAAIPLLEYFGDIESLIISYLLSFSRLPWHFLLPYPCDARQ